MDLDFSTVGSKTIVIALHGLEGSSKSKYIVSIANQLNKNNIDIVAVNFRGCSGEQNRVYSSYHSGRTEDLNAVIQYITDYYSYQKIILLGFSLGGNMALKYLGEHNHNLHKNITCALAISVPCDLASSSEALKHPRNFIYMKRFLRTLKSKTLEKLTNFPNAPLDNKKIENVRNFYDYDTLFTAPANGFLSAEDYWEQSSCKKYLQNINIPTLLVISKDDTFLGESCYPFEIAKNHTYLHLEVTKYGGHVGFNQQLFGKNGFWLEKRIISFIAEQNYSKS